MRLDRSRSGMARRYLIESEVPLRLGALWENATFLLVGCATLARRTGTSSPFEAAATRLGCHQGACVVATLGHLRPSTSSKTHTRTVPLVRSTNARTIHVAMRSSVHDGDQHDGMSRSQAATRIAPVDVRTR